MAGVGYCYSRVTTCHKMEGVDRYGKNVGVRIIQVANVSDNLKHREARNNKRARTNSDPTVRLPSKEGKQ